MAGRILFSLLTSLTFSISGSMHAQSDVLFEDTFSGTDGTVIATGSEEVYQIVGRTDTVMTPTIQGDRLALAIGPNLNDANSFSVLHQNTRFDFLSEPLLFEADVELGDAVTMVFGLHTWLGNSRLDASANHLAVTFYNDGNRLLLTGREGGVATATRYEMNDFTTKTFRLGLYLDETDVKLLMDGIVVYNDAHRLSPTAFETGGYLGLQLYGGGSGNAHTSYFDNLRFVSNPDLTLEPAVIVSDDFSGEDGLIPVGSSDTYRTAVRDNGVLTVERENERLKLSMGPNATSASTFGMVHHSSRFPFDESPLLFEVDVDRGDMSTLAIGLHDWLGNSSLLYGNNVSVTWYGGNRMLLVTRNAGTQTETRYDSGENGFPAQTFRLGLYLDETDLKLLVDGEILYESPHNLAQTLLDNGVYFGVQLYGGGGVVQSAAFDNLTVTANPDMTPDEIVPGDIFWTSASGIRSARFDGSDVRTVVGGLGRPIGIAVDFVAEQMYWVEHDTGRLMRANTDGTDIAELRSDLLVGQFLALEVESGRLFWSEWNDGLSTGLTDGSGRTQIILDAFNGNAGVALSGDRAFLVSANTGAVTSVDLDGTEEPASVTMFAGQTYAIAVAPSGEEMYATNFSEGWIKGYNLETGAAWTVWDDDLSRPLGLAVSSDGEKLYWAERTLDEANGRIRVANTDGSGAIETLLTGESSPFGIAVRSFSADPPSGFLAWIETWDLGEGERGAQDNPSGDGIPNLLKFALGLDPTTTSSPSALPRPALEDVDGNRYLTLTVDRSAAATGVSWTFETSSELGTWSSEDVVTSEDGNTLTGVDVIPVGESPRRFIRARLDVE